jgi:hypothetical protein
MEKDWFTKYHRRQRRFLWLPVAAFLALLACVALASAVASVMVP